MLQDYVRTATYQRAMLVNSNDFSNKVVLDVGAGTGVLSFFAVQAGAKRVYAVEASSMATHLKVRFKLYYVKLVYASIFIKEDDAKCDE